MAYNSLQTEEAKRDFLDKQRQKIAQMTPEQRQLHQVAIAHSPAREGWRNGGVQLLELCRSTGGFKGLAQGF